MKGYNKETGKPHQPPKSPGRTPKDPSQVRVTKTFRILPEVKAIIESKENPTEWLEQLVLKNRE
ncbi:hypothetical protein BWI97_07290 [Siphonobacter sp. BAB-5405]|uniref:hypothetical protein n=1 Tax=Siphonobacter sp. BAB-5405 TaxID=1864825 RepID=UPI000C800A78|nr:hypothetical protein [Siphonobacter sp. BAB-5405]PMD97427.1 hypothetical protein BWI97_07290 [Siphonobacter sp. BAB-5405]